jgi:hypothetical protein
MASGITSTTSLGSSRMQGEDHGPIQAMVPQRSAVSKTSSGLSDMREAEPPISVDEALLRLGAAAVAVGAVLLVVTDRQSPRLDMGAHQPVRRTQLLVR